MDTIEIRVRKAPNTSDAIQAIRTVTGGSLGAIEAALAEGAPVYSAQLYSNDFVEVADNVRSLVHRLTACGAELQVAERGQLLNGEGLTNLLARAEQYR